MMYAPKSHPKGACVNFWNTGRAGTGNSDAPKPKTDN